MIFPYQKRDALNPEGYSVSIKSLLLSTLAINILSLALPVMTLQVYDRILPNQGSGTLPVLITGVAAAIFLEAALRLARSYVLGWAGAAYEHRISCAAMNHILNADLSRLGPYGIGEHIQRMGAVSKLKDFYNGYALMTLFEMIFVPLFLGIIIYIAGPLTIVPCVVLMLFTVMSLSQGQRLRAALKARDKTDDKRYDFLIESLDGVHTIKSFALENNFSRRYETLEESSTLSNYEVTEATSGTFDAASVFSHIMVAAVISIGALFVLHGDITTGALVATLLLSGRMMQPLQRALSLWTKYQDYIVSRQKVEAIFETPQYPGTPANDQNTVRAGRIQMTGVSFRHNDDKPWLLDDIHFKLERNDVVLLSGAHGSGKSLFLQLIAGIYPPGRGTIDIDERNILRYSPENLIHHVGLIHSEGIIFRGTIRDNMTCFGQIPEKDVREIASILKIDRDIARLPSGFDTMLGGNNTDSVPPGLKQRIAMARVLAPRPRLILFDNADRGLDREGYSVIYGLLARLQGKAGMILVSDDQNIKGLATRFCVLENGKIRETEESYSTGHIKPYSELRL
jgi:ATP-binding cassette subfamily C protein LapB